MSKVEIIKSIDMDELKEKILASSKTTSIYVGCDSIEKSKEFTRFVTVVVLHYDSSKGAVCFYESVMENRIMSMRERLLKEVYYAVGIAIEVNEFVGERKMEVHIDINEDERAGSYIVLKEAKGYVTGQGFVVKSKPDSWCATAVADYMVRNK